MYFMSDLIRETYETRLMFLGRQGGVPEWAKCEVWTYHYRDGGVERLIKKLEVL